MKKIVLLLSLLLNVQSGVGSELIAHWDFNQLEGNRILDRLGNQAIIVEGDLSANLIQPGLEGQALFFDIGSNRLILPHSKTVNLVNDFTITLEMKPDTVVGYRTILWKGRRSVQPEVVNYSVGIRDGKFEFKYKDSAGEWIVHQTAKIIEPDKWHHLVIYYNSGRCEIYVNGTLGLSEAVTEPLELVSSTYDCMLGRGEARRGETFFFCGLLDDLKIYKGKYINLAPDYQRTRSKNLENYKQRMKLYTAQMLEIQKEKSRKLAEEYREFFSRKAGDNPFGALLIPVTGRLLQNNDFFKDPALHDNAVFSLSAAGRELESAQVVVLGNPDHKIKINSIQVSELTNGDGEAIPSANISIGRVGFVTSEKPDIPVDFIGAFPDPVFLGETTLNIEAGKFGLACIRINTVGVSPGIYTGNVIVQNDTTELKTPIRIKIYDFELPLRSSLRSTFSFFEQEYQQWYGLSEISLEQRLKIYDFLLQYRLAPGNIYAHPNEPSPRFDALAVLKERINFFILQSWDSSQNLETKIAAYAAEIKQARNLGIAEQMYFYSFDEILGSPQSFSAAKRATSALKAAFPSIKLLQTSFPEEVIRNYFNAWAPLLCDFANPERLEVLKQLKARGDEIWWYLADQPAKPFPNLFLDYPVFDNRIIGTLSYMYQVDGLLYWCINREWRTNLDIRKKWPDAEWKPYIFHSLYKTRKSKNGMGNLIYPGRNGELLPSLRLENLRDGLEDYEYMAMLKRLVAKLPNNDLNRGEAEKLLEIPPAVARAVNDYSADPQHLVKYREQLALMIEKLNGSIKQDDLQN